MHVQRTILLLINLYLIIKHRVLLVVRHAFFAKKPLRFAEINPQYYRNQVKKKSSLAGTIPRSSPRPPPSPCPALPAPPSPCPSFPGGACARRPTRLGPAAVPGRARRPASVPLDRARPAPLAPPPAAPSPTPPWPCPVSPAFMPGLARTAVALPGLARAAMAMSGLARLLARLLPTLNCCSCYCWPDTHSRALLVESCGEGRWERESALAGREGRKKKGEEWWWRSKAVRGCGWMRPVSSRSQREPRAQEEARMSSAGSAGPLGHGACGEGWAVQIGSEARLLAGSGARGRRQGRTARSGRQQRSSKAPNHGVLWVTRR